MKLAIIGKGKTGGHVIDMAKRKKINFEIFDSANPPTAKKLIDGRFDVAVAFVNGEVFKKLMPELVASKIPVVTGATGITFDDKLDEQLKNIGTSWVWATNFSLGMRIVHGMIKLLAQANKIMGECHYKIHEIHHTQKLDRPSGTAISWAKWLGHPVVITDERTGDVVGDHKMTLQADHEQIIVRHQALDRGIFAAGALWACELCFNKKVPHGFNLFENIANRELGL